MDCFQDFCLFCDRESPDGHYCSQACKLADLERSGPCEASSPLDRTHLPTRGASTHPLITNLPNNNPAHTSRQSSTSSTSSSPTYSSSPERQLTPSSSRSSLSSASSLWAASSPTDALSAQARHDLHDYFSSFDQVRAAKRRSSLR